MGKHVLGWVGTMMLVVGCGGGGEFAMSKSPSGTAAPDSYGGYGSGTTASGEALNTTAPEERPGLGTGWGESRVSHVHEVAFERDGATPFATGTLHYNDRTGVSALASYHQAMTGGFLHDVPEAGGAITVAIVGEDGRPLDALKMNERTYVIGHEGERYAIVMTNHTNHRFESVATVDGLDVINGRPASLDNRGYILTPWARLEIDGFRQEQRRRGGVSVLEDG